MNQADVLCLRLTELATDVRRHVDAATVVKVVTPLVEKLEQALLKHAPAVAASSATTVLVGKASSSSSKSKAKARKRPASFTLKPEGDGQPVAKVPRKRRNTKNSSSITSYAAVDVKLLTEKHPFACQVEGCAFTCGRHKTLLQHVRAHDGKTEVDVVGCVGVNPQPHPNGVGTICPTCDEKYENLPTLRRHFLRHHVIATFTCPNVWCRFKTSYDSDARDHEKNCIQRQCLLYGTEHCNSKAVFGSKRALKKHLRTFHQNLVTLGAIDLNELKMMCPLTEIPANCPEAAPVAGEAVVDSGIAVVAAQAQGGANPPIATARRTRRQQ